MSLGPLPAYPKLGTRILVGIQIFYAEPGGGANEGAHEKLS